MLRRVLGVSPSSRKKCYPQRQNAVISLPVEKKRLYYCLSPPSRATQPSFTFRTERSSTVLISLFLLLLFIPVTTTASYNVPPILLFRPTWNETLDAPYPTPDRTMYRCASTVTPRTLPGLRPRSESTSV